jgi:hypothetical protein
MILKYPSGCLAASENMDKIGHEKENREKIWEKCNHIIP